MFQEASSNALPRYCFRRPLFYRHKASGFDDEVRSSTKPDHAKEIVRGLQAGPFCPLVWLPKVVLQCGGQIDAVREPCAHLFDVAKLPFFWRSLLE